ncbi:MAG: tRNA-dihydrouridine synthase family protein [Bacteroides sp.]|nr:tRNA-dihydrouridine synthase family protein [Roseburia sp.]MCM1345507.1 tRNA-dihydrouridine synthase family protein [Bacteroides sp.]MCM1420016.1 tRNA-dihydrouridine synthase family protein [Bacteroides sp.]
MTPIYFAPIQGYTDDAYRRIHAEMVGGTEIYFSPFIRIEHNKMRNKDIRDIHPQYNKGINLIPQILCNSTKEFDLLVDTIAEMGYSRIDINMGCPFTLQTRHGKGAGLLQHPDTVEELMKAVSNRKDISFSVKMRLGQECADEGLAVLPILNDAPLAHITIHPRLGIQQYKGETDMESFRRFYESCKHPVVFNGDILSMDDIRRTEQEFPNLKAIMVGRGLLARPSLAAEYASGKEWTAERRLSLIKGMHAKLLEHYSSVIPGEMQLLSKMRTFWEYMEPEIGRKQQKKIMKAGNMKNYMKEVGNVSINPASSI